jgi:dihydrodipicolinate synthase/N-acetylneuraminate lyase
MANKAVLSGIIAPVITPFTKEETLDETIFRREVKYLLNTGIHGISPGGSTGEGELVRDKDLLRMIEIIQEENSKKIPVVAGVIRNSTQETLDTALAAKKAGATALMVQPIRYLGGADAEGNYQFYAQISEAVGLPLIIYNAVLQSEVKPDEFVKLLEIENVVAIKQCQGNYGLQGFLEMVLACGEKGQVLSAIDEMLYTTFDLGAGGALATVLTVFPELAVEIWDAVQVGNSGHAKALQAKLYPTWTKIHGLRFQRRVKETLRQLGRPVGIAASPRGAASPAEKETIRKALQLLKE